jgi:hypothetical protein
LHEAFHLRPVAEERNLTLLPLRVHNQHNILRAGRPWLRCQQAALLGDAAHMRPLSTHPLLRV